MKSTSTAIQTSPTIQPIVEVATTIKSDSLATTMGKPATKESIETTTITFRPAAVTTTINQESVTPIPVTTPTTTTVPPTKVSSIVEMTSQQPASKLTTLVDTNGPVREPSINMKMDQPELITFSFSTPSEVVTATKASQTDKSEKSAARVTITTSPSTPPTITSTTRTPTTRWTITTKVGLATEKQQSFLQKADDFIERNIVNFKRFF